MQVCEGWNNITETGQMKKLIRCKRGLSFMISWFDG